MASSLIYLQYAAYIPWDQNVLKFCGIYAGTMHSNACGMTHRRCGYCFQSAPKVNNTNNEAFCAVQYEKKKRQVQAVKNALGTCNCGFWRFSS